jgi:uncharacterized membrane protein YedE/YeeE
MNNPETILEKQPIAEHPVECEAPNNQVVRESLFLSNIKYLIAGAVFGIVLVKTEIISWYRIQEMFRLHSFHMYGVIGTALLTGMLSVWLIKKFKLKTLYGEPVVIPAKQFHWGNVFGGLMFGVGWGITGACPGPLFAQIGSGFLAIGVTLLSAIAGTWVYGWMRDRLPH